ncbi:MAG: NAD-binding protein [bacterium]|nr:NAD-binding protein [bacterium]
MGSMHLKRLWPFAPLALLVLASGALNLAAGMGGLPHDLQAFDAAAQFNGSLSIFGRSSQALLGGALMICGVGLFWRLRTPWAFAILLSVITIGVDIFRHQWNASLVGPVLIFLGLIFYNAHFQRRALAASIVVSLLSVATVVAYGTVGTFLLGNGFRPAIVNASTAFYFTMVTLSTVGYGDIVPVTTQARLLTVSLIVFGIAIFAAAIATTLGPVITTEFSRVFGGKEKDVETSDHVIVVGDGDIAEHTAAELTASGHRVVRIVDVERALDAQALGDANIARATMVVAACSDDSKNAVISLIAKDLNPKIRVIAVAGSTGGLRRLKLAHADAVFAPSVLGARLLAQIANGETLPAAYADLFSTATSAESKS